MSSSATAAKLRQAVQAGLYEDELCSSVEQLFRSNTESAESILDKFNANTPAGMPERSVWALAKVLLRFSQLFHPDKLRCWFPILLKSLETRDAELVKCLGLLSKELSLRDRRFEEDLLAAYFSVGEPNEQILLQSLDPSRMKHFFANLNQFLASSDPLHSLRAIELLSFVAHKQGPNLNQISETPTFATLLKLMQETPQTAVMLAALLCLCMFVPWVLPALPALLPRIFAIIKRAVCWNFDETLHELPAKEMQKKRSMSGSDPGSPRSSSVPPSKASSSSSLSNSGSSNPLSPRSSSAGPSSGTPTSGGIRKSSGSTSTTASVVASLLRRAQSSPMSHDSEDSSESESFDAASLSAMRPRTPSGDGALIPKPTSSEQSGNSPNQPKAIPLQMRELMRRCGVVLLRLIQSLFPSSLLEYLRTECTKDESFRQAVTPMLAALRWNSWILESDPGKELSLQRWRTVNPYQFLVDAVFGEYRTEVDRLWALNAALTSTTPVTSSHAAAATEIQLKAQIMQLQSELGIGSSHQQTQAVDGVSASGNALDLASLGQTIMKLQNLLERALYVQSTSKTTVPEELSLSSNAAELQTWVTILRNQLLFEKFVRHQLQNRLISMQKDAVQVDQVVAEKDAMQAQLAQQQTVQDELFSRWREQQDRINALQDQNRKMHENHTKQLAGMQDQINTVTEERDGLAELLEVQREEMANLKKQLAATEGKNFQLEATLSTTSQSGPSTASLEAQLKSMKKQLLLWEEHRKFVERERAQIEEMREKIATQETLLLQANRAHEQASNKTASISAKLEETIQRLSQAKTDNHDLKQRNQKLQLLLENQRIVSQSKIASVEEKYSTLKLITQGYEKQLLDLRAEMEKLQAVASSGFRSDPPSPAPSLSSSNSSLALSK